MYASVSYIIESVHPQLVLPPILRTSHAHPQYTFGFDCTQTVAIKGNDELEILHLDLIN